ncbi:Asp-tRNA(Asn)/Glu-tRNA(Gln) amidotransferase subunit GatC [Candidatus Saccharibacteria bacterium]|nr:Asp-tRNA(Asn)/Glu-tRNA(Gln) amidotransferase subunit GatC [Candidatus Saccharibacteria bacterium]
MNARNPLGVDQTTVEHLASLASITVSDEELTLLVGDLNKIIGSIDKLQDLDTSGVEPTCQVTGLTSVWRNDIIEPQLPREKLLALAPDSKNNQVKVPKVL